MEFWFILCMVTTITTILADQCFDPNNTLQDSLVGQKLEEASLSILTSLGPLDCYRKCRRYSWCQTVNFQSVSHQCELLPVADGNFITNLKYNFIDVRSWTIDFLDNCSNHQCPNNTYCEDDNDGYKCTPFGCIEAPFPDNVNATSFTSKLLWNLNESVLYVCNRGYFPSQNVYCESSGNFTTFICKPFEKCSFIEECDPNAQQGEYLIYSPKVSTWLNVFCLNMVGAYIPLIHRNFAHFPSITRSNSSCELVDIDPSTSGAGTTEFTKRRYRMDHGKIWSYGSQFQTTTGKRQYLGSAGDCYAVNDDSLCGVLGHFIIDLRDTGLRVQSSVEWTTFGNNSVIANITRSDGDQVIEGFCGGNCGGCLLENRDIAVEAYPGYIPDMESAFICMNLTS